MNMESNDFGADRARMELKTAEKNAYFAEIRKRLIDSGAEPLSRGEFERQVAEASERNRKQREEPANGQDTPDTAA